MVTFLQLKRAVTRLIAAEVSDAWKGAGDPADIRATEKELKEARANYKRIVGELEHKLDCYVKDRT